MPLFRPEELAAQARARACISDLGFSPELVGLNYQTGRVAVDISVPLAVAYMTMKLAYPGDREIACWTCYSVEPFDMARANACAEGKCPDPDGRRLPPAELVVASRRG